MSTDDKRASIEEGWICDIPPDGMTLVEAYEEAMFLKKECRRDALKKIAYETPIVLVWAALFYYQWPWVGLVVLVVGSLVIFYIWASQDFRYYPRSPWQHPLYDGDFTRLSPANVVFSRHSDEHGKLDQLDVLLQKNGDYLQLSITRPKSPAHVLREGKTLGRREYLVELVSAVQRELDYVK